MKKKILDEFFYEIYNDQNIFQQFYNFYTGQDTHFNFLAFLNLINDKKEEKRKMKMDNNKKNKDSEPSSSPLTNLFNFLKGRKAEKSQEQGEGEGEGEGEGIGILPRLRQRVRERNEAFISKMKKEDGGIVADRLDSTQNANDDYKETNKENAEKKKHESFNFSYYWDNFNYKRKQKMVDSPFNKCNTEVAKNNRSIDIHHTGREQKEQQEQRKQREKDYIKSEKMPENKDEHEEAATYHASINKSKGSQRKEERNGKREDFSMYINKNNSLNVERKESRQERKKNDENQKKVYCLKSEVHNIYTYIDIICYNYILKKEVNCKIYKCFIIHIYQPLIPHNIRTNNMLNNFIKYVKYLQIVKKKRKDTRADPNRYLNCNKVEPRFFFNFSYMTFNHLRKLNFPNSFLLNNLLQEDTTHSEKGSFSRQETETDVDKENDYKNDDADSDEEGLYGDVESWGEQNVVNEATFEGEHIKSLNEWKEENINNSILNKSWIKNKPELGICKLMLYDNLLILYGTPYLYNATSSSKKSKANAHKGKETKIETEKKDIKIGSEYIEKEKEKTENNISDKCKRDNENVDTHKASSEEKKLKPKNGKKYKETEEENINSYIDIGTLNFIKEKKEYTQERQPFNYYNHTDDDVDDVGDAVDAGNVGDDDDDDDDTDDELNEETDKEAKREDILNKIIIHKYKDLKKKDILFNLDCYKINSIDLNWYKVSDSLFKEINKEHMLDIYNYYKSYFNLSRNVLMAKEEKKKEIEKEKMKNKKKETEIENFDEPLKDYTSGISSSTVMSDYSDDINLCDDVELSDDIDFSFSDYHNLYKDDEKIVFNKTSKKRKRLKTEKRENGEKEKNMPIDVVNVYAIFDLHTIYKITTKKKSSTALYFYFTSNKQIPLIVVNFDSEVEAQSCVFSIKEIYANFAKQK